MKKLLSALMILFLIPFCIAGCSSDNTQTEVPEEAESIADDPSTDYTSGIPWLCSDLDGVVTEDTSAEVKDDFALYANKDDILKLEVPDGYAAAGPIVDVLVQETDDIKNMLKNAKPETQEAKLASDLYHLMSDWDTRNKLGVAPLKEKVDAVESIETIDDLTAYFLNTPETEQMGQVWYAGPGLDLEDSETTVMKVSNFRLFLQDAAEYTELSDFGEIFRDAKSRLGSKMLVKLGYPEKEAQQKIDNCIEFEKKIAPYIYTADETREPEFASRVNNHYTREQLKEAEGVLPVIEMLEANGYPELDNYIVENPEFLAEMNKLYTEENLPLIKDMLIVKGSISAAGDLDRECYEWSNECSNEMEGVDASPDDDTMFTQGISGRLKWAVGRLYTETYLNKEDKDRITEMVEEIKENYYGIIEDAEFLSDETRAKAIEKLDAIDVRVLYPDNWEEYEYTGLDFAGPEDGGTLWDAMRSIDAYEYKKEIEELTKPVDKNKWSAAPQEVNCYYDPHANCIYIMGAYASGNIYNSSMSDEEVLAKLGVSIGHEISHAFDSTGAQFDKNGNYKNWWADEDYEKFKERNKKLQAYYDGIHPWEGQNLSSSIMTGESCADMAGMKVILRIASKKDNFDYDKFFRSFANLWLTKSTLMAVRSNIGDSHPLNYLRINCTLQQYDEFLDCYGIKEGDNMYLAPENRVNIW